jgi:hypothetical protein
MSWDPDRYLRFASLLGARPTGRLEPARPDYSST